MAGRNLWNLLKSLLNSHEQQRFMLLSKISTDLGRGRAWIRLEPFFILIDRDLLFPDFVLHTYYSHHKQFSPLRLSDDTMYVSM